MVNFFQLLLKRFVFNFKAANPNGHGTHSPFVYHFITEILNDTRFFYAFELIENQKKIFNSATNRLTNKKHAENINALIKNLPNSKYHQLLFRIVHYYQPTSVLEIGSSLGFTTAYLSSANRNISVTNLIETPIQDLLTKENLKETGTNNACVLLSNKLSLSIHELLNKKFGLILINNSQIDHEINAEELLKIAEENSIIIFFSKNESLSENILWNKVINFSAKTIAIELLCMRIAIFRKEQYEKEQFTIQF